jgi:hypothetical protein
MSEVGLPAAATIPTMSASLVYLILRQILTQFARDGGA